MNNGIYRLPSGATVTNVVKQLPNLTVGKGHLVTMINGKDQGEGITYNLAYWEVSEGFTDMDYLDFINALLEIDPNTLVGRFVVNEVEGNYLTLHYEDEPHPRRYFFDVESKQVNLLPEHYH